MAYNYALFEALLRKVYSSLENREYFFSLKESLDIFFYYFDKYEESRGEIHPNIRISQIEQIEKKMPFFDDQIGPINSFEADHYFAMIDCHFQTQYRNCDYNINHFFSGDIRYYKFCETCV